MTYRFSFPGLITMLLILAVFNIQEASYAQSENSAQDVDQVAKKKAEPHRYGGWYCPDNFGFVPVDIGKLHDVPAISNRLPTEQELHDKKSLIHVDTEKYPDARALEMNLPRVARIYSKRIGLDELIIVIQAVIVQGDTVVGYRFANGGNGSSWITDVTFLPEEEVAEFGFQPFFFSKSVVKAGTKDIWKAVGKTDYFKQLGEKFDKKDFFSADWNAESTAHLVLDTNEEQAVGFVGMVYGNYYLQIDYNRDGFHYSEKLLMIENHEDHTTELFFASGPFPEDFEKQKSKLDKWIETIRQASEGG